MLLDSQNLFSDNQKITSGTIYSTNTVKFGLGDISYLPLLVQVTKAFSGLTSLKVSVVTSKDENFSEEKELVSSTLELASLKEGAKFPISFMPKGNLGFVKLKYEITGTEEEGEITAGIVVQNDIEFEK